jgi:hypothetical protein
MEVSSSTSGNSGQSGRSGGPKRTNRSDKWQGNPKKRKERKSVSVSAPAIFKLPPAVQRINTKKYYHNMRSFRISVVEVLGRDYPNYWPEQRQSQPVSGTSHTTAIYTTGQQNGTAAAGQPSDRSSGSDVTSGYTSSFRSAAGQSAASATGMQQPHFVRSPQPAFTATSSSASFQSGPYSQMGANVTPVTPVIATPSPGNWAAANSMGRTYVTAHPQSGYPTPGWSTDSAASVSGSPALWPRPIHYSGGPNPGHGAGVTSYTPQSSGSSYQWQ